MPKSRSRSVNGNHLGLLPLANATHDLPPLNGSDLQPLGDLNLPLLRDGDLGLLPFGKFKGE
jgi:hypothetical protein